MSFDIANDFYPVITEELAITANGPFAQGITLREFGTGFLVLWTPLTYVDGSYTLDIQESTDGGSTGNTIDTERLIVPQIAKDNGLNEDDLTQILTPGDRFLGAGDNVPRQLGVKDFATDAVRLVINASGVTTGATILLQLWAKSPRLAVRESHFNSIP